MLSKQLKAGHEQAGATSPAIAVDGDFSGVQLPHYGDAMARTKNAYVEWADQYGEYAVFLPIDDALDVAAACDRMRAAGLIQYAEIWPSNAVPDETRKRLWRAVNKRRREWVDVRWKCLFGQYGYHGRLQK